MRDTIRERLRDYGATAVVATFFIIVAGLVFALASSFNPADVIANVVSEAGIVALLIVGIGLIRIFVKRTRAIKEASHIHELVAHDSQRLSDDIRLLERISGLEVLDDDSPVLMYGDLMVYFVWDADAVDRAAVDARRFVVQFGLPDLTPLYRGALKSLRAPKETAYKIDAIMKLPVRSRSTSIFNLGNEKRKTWFSAKRANRLIARLRDQMANLQAYDKQLEELLHGEFSPLSLARRRIPSPWPSFVTAAALASGLIAVGVTATAFIVPAIFIDGFGMNVLLNFLASVSFFSLATAVAIFATQHEKIRGRRENSADLRMVTSALGALVHVSGLGPGADRTSALRSLSSQIGESFGRLNHDFADAQSQSSVAELQRLVQRMIATKDPGSIGNLLLSDSVAVPVPTPLSSQISSLSLSLQSRISENYF
jgi:hypothetical protein